MVFHRDDDLHDDGSHDGDDRGRARRGFDTKKGNLKILTPV